MLQVRNVDFDYGSRQILRDVSFDIPDHSVVSVLGPNGTGKTILLNCICNVNEYRSGSITIDGTDVRTLKGKEMAKAIGYVPQSAPRTRMTVFDSVLLGRKPYFELNASKKDLKKVADIIAQLHMEDYSLRYNTEISGGEFQKMQIARAAVQEPRLLILDEPTNNLDISNQQAVVDLVEELVEHNGMSVLMTMHDLNLAAQCSDAILVMSRGSVRGFGGPEIITPELVEEVYGIEVDVIVHEGTPVIVPKKRSRRR